MNIEELSLDVGLTPVDQGIEVASDSAVITSDALAAPELGEAAAPAGVTPKITYKGGPLLTNASLVVIFWGSAWQGTAPPSVRDIGTAVENILSGPYMSKLSQYQNIGPATISAGGILPTSDPPSSFTIKDVIDVITGLIDSKSLPAPSSNSQLLYWVFMPVGASFSGNPKALGLHGYFTYTDGSKVHYACQTNPGDLQSITTAFSFFLVGSCTDPELNGFQAQPEACGRQQGLCEIEMICRNPAVVGGVKVWTYWSEADQNCVAPGGS